MIKQIKTNLELSRDFDIVLSILKSSHNKKYSVDLYRRISRLCSDIFGRFSQYDKRHDLMIKRHSYSKITNERLKGGR